MPNWPYCVMDKARIKQTNQRIIFASSLRLQDSAFFTQLSCTVPESENVRIIPFQTNDGSGTNYTTPLCSSLWAPPPFLLFCLSIDNACRYSTRRQRLHRTTLLSELLGGACRYSARRLHLQSFVMLSLFKRKSHLCESFLHSTFWNCFGKNIG